MNRLLHTRCNLRRSSVKRRASRDLLHGSGGGEDGGTCGSGGGDSSRGLVTVASVLFDVIIVGVMWMMALAVVVVMALRCGSAGGCSDHGADFFF